ncbi:unnamed protein product [Protopolystoma xenopodis]|uniref:Uncharacterized protein n=1 Tax=Protopolystoma xenopodis TaxID=117903 RepID=A0A448WTL5_9PLAT|nr:unnamed protein product [Protopolystoma xenopodis]
MAINKLSPGATAAEKTGRTFNFKYKSSGTIGTGQTRRTNSKAAAASQISSASSPASGPASASTVSTQSSCRRLLSDQRFLVSFIRHLDSPHALIRAKTYLVCSAFLATSPSESLPIACQTRLPACLERDLRATQRLHARYCPEATRELAQSDASLLACLDARLSAGRFCESSSTSGGDEAKPAGGAGLEASSDSWWSANLYLAACALHLADLLRFCLIPLVCRQAAGCLGLRLGQSDAAGQPGVNLTRTGSAGSSTSRRLTRGSSIRAADCEEAGGRNHHASARRQAGRPQSMYAGLASPLSAGTVAANATGTSAGSATATGTGQTCAAGFRAWLPAFSCLPGLLSTCISLRNSLYVSGYDGSRSAEVLLSSAGANRKSFGPIGESEQANTEPDGRTTDQVVADVRLNNDSDQVVELQTPSQQQICQRENTPIEKDFCMLMFLGSLLNHWASKEPIAAAGRPIHL